MPDSDFRVIGIVQGCALIIALNTFRGRRPPQLRETYAPCIATRHEAATEVTVNRAAAAVAPSAGAIFMLGPISRAATIWRYSGSSERLELLVFVLVVGVAVIVRFCLLIIVIVRRAEPGNRFAFWFGTR